MAYVYRHIRLDKNEPFYIGIGSDSEGEYKRANWDYQRNNIWNKITAKTTYKVEILFDDLTWENACEKEIEFIALYGRINTKNGILANLTDGGEGVLGHKHSEESRRKNSESKKGKTSNRKGVKLSEETKQKMRDNSWLKNEGIIHPMKGKKHSEKSKKQMSESGKKVFEDPKQREKQRFARLGKKPSNAKKVVRLIDGKVYESIQDASKDNAVPKSSLLRFLNGTYENKTGLELLDI